jgi:DNA-binding protein H-NS
MARSAVPDVIREKIHELQSKLERIETQQRETRVAALGFISEALERLGLTLQDLAAGVGARRGRTAKVGRPSTRGKKQAATKARKRGRPAKVAKVAKVAKKGTDAKGKKTAKRGASKRGKVPAKYRGPNGEAWSGRGKQPRWLAALVAGGRSPAEFLI